MKAVKTFQDRVLGVLSPTDGKSAVRVWRELNMADKNLVEVRNSLRDLVAASCATFAHEDFYRVYFGISHEKEERKRGRFA